MKLICISTHLDKVSGELLMRLLVPTQERVASVLAQLGWSVERENLQTVWQTVKEMNGVAERQVEVVRTEKTK